MNAWLGFVKMHARECHVITHVLSLILLSSSRPLLVTHAWHKKLDFQQWNTSSLIIFWFKVLI